MSSASPLGAAAMPRTLDRAGIAARIPHRGTMCLLDAMRSCDDARIECVARNHRDPGHPLRTRSGLVATAAIEYAAQAMALHGALSAPPAASANAHPASVDAAAVATDETAPPAHGFLASVRDVRVFVRTLDDLPATADDELVVVAERQAADPLRVLYAFVVRHGDRPVASGRAAVVLDAAAPAAPASQASQASHASQASQASPASASP